MKIDTAFSLHVTSIINRQFDGIFTIVGGQLGGQPSVHTEDARGEDGHEWETVERVAEGLPELDVVSALALVVEAVDAVDGGALVVAAQQEEVLRELDLVRQQEADGLERLLAAVHVVAKENVLRLRGEGIAADVEKLDEIVVLPVYVAHHLKQWVFSSNHPAILRGLGLGFSRKMSLNSYG